MFSNAPKSECGTFEFLVRRFALKSIGGFLRLMVM